MMEDEIEQEVEELEVETSEVEEETEVVAEEVAIEEEAETEPEEEELVISIDGEEVATEEVETKETPQWVKDVRNDNRALKKKVRDLEKQAATKEEATEMVPTLGKKPTIEDDGIDYDTDIFAKKLEEWHNQKIDYDKAQVEIEAKKGEQAKSWQKRVDVYTEKKTALKVRDYDEVEEIVKDTLSVTQQGIILQAAEDPALLVYAIGKNPKKAEELKSITDPVLFTAAITRLEGKMTVNKRKAATKPEKKIKSGGASLSDSTLDKLREEASKTGDFNKVADYKRKLKASKK